MGRTARRNGLQANGNSAKAKNSRSAKLADIPSDSFTQLWKRLDALYDDCSTELLDVSRASTLSRIAGRQLTLLGMAIAFQRNTDARKRLVPAGKISLPETRR